MSSNRSYDSPVRGQLPVNNNKVLCTRFRDQKFDPDFVFPATRLPGAKDPPNVLRPEDLLRDNSNHFGNFRGRGRGGGRGKSLIIFHFIIKSVIIALQYNETYVFI